MKDLLYDWLEQYSIQINEEKLLIFRKKEQMNLKVKSLNIFYEITLSTLALVATG
jgi:hypothetical protein